ncbi:MAG: ABC-type transport auxiliary lipoprotein family protein [Pseudomonadota bacterium]|nr:ABC-type transport auxiliary lipoprotein family protein [Pseudomonadota bacterium]
MKTSPLPRQRLLHSAFAVLALVLLNACALVGGGSREGPVVYAPDPRVPVDPSWPSVQWQLSVTTPVASRMLDSTRIAVRPAANEIQVYKGATWAKRPSAMLEDALLRALEDSGRIPAVARQGSGVSADYKLVLDLRRFESDYVQPGAPPLATIEVNAKLLHAKDQQVIATRTFLETRPAAGTAVPQVVSAFESALGEVSQELAGWVLTSGHAHEQSAHR